MLVSNKCQLDGAVCLCVYYKCHTAKLFPFICRHMCALCVYTSVHKFPFFHSHVGTSPCARVCVCVSMCRCVSSSFLFLYFCISYYTFLITFSISHAISNRISFHFQLVWFHICSMVLLVLWVCSMSPPMSTLAGHFVSIYSSANP